MVFDAVATVASFLIALALRFDAPSALFDQYLAAYFWVIPALVVVRLGAFMLLRLYQRVWRYASVDELIAVLAAVAGSSTAAYIAIYAVALSSPFRTIGFPRSVAIIDTIFMVALAGAWRFALRAIGAGRAGAAFAPGGSESALVLGNGAPVLQVLRELRSNPALGLKAVGILSDEFPRGQRLLGIPTIGATTDLAAAIAGTGASIVLLAVPSSDGRVLRKLVHQAEAAGARCLTVPSVAEVVAGRVSMNAVREVEIEDLMRRAPSRIDLASVAGSFEGRSVLITGAGGSIGGELARQIIRFRPKRLVLLGRGENSIFETIQSLAALDSSTAAMPVILDIRDRDRLSQLFRSVRPDVVFHAAAHKHVTFMEEFPDQAVATNVVGTTNVLDASAESEVGRFVFISTDKAVNPSSVMGATKRIGELLVRQTARERDLPYAVVRFGNVLSSRGSVVPLFRQQLARGGPITVTDPGAKRFFMTIPEAVQLVLQAAILASPGDTFVLDMGEAVRIVELARDLIELHGLEPDKDVDITYIGSRPGEKLEEELYFRSERPEETSHEAIRRVRLGVHSSVDLRPAVSRLASTALTGDRESIVGELRAIVPEYQPFGMSDSPPPEQIVGAREGQESS
jgi:FlaA1/EpsC-like NDP-sugar epimerase